MTAGGAIAAFPTGIFATAPAESSYDVETIVGSLPPGLHGTAYWNGPGRFGFGSRRARHWLDGDGMIAALDIRGERIRFANRFVRTRKWEDEEAAGLPLFRCFGTAFPGDRTMRGIALESPANVSVVPFDGALLAFGEQGLPWRIDPGSLETHGQCTFGGAVNGVTPFAAHAKLEPDTGALVNFGVSFDAAKPCVFLYRFAPNAALVGRRRIPLEWPCSIHDFALTRRYALFYVSPYLVNVTALARGGTLLDALTWRPQLGSRIIIVDCGDGATRTIRIPGRYCLHTINAFEADGLLFLDVLELDRPVYDQYLLDSLLDDPPAGRAVRFILEPDAERVIERIDTAYDRAPDFPVAPPESGGRAYEWFAALGLSAARSRGRKLYDEIVRTRWRAPLAPEVYRAPAGVFFAGEPVVVPGARPGTHTLICPMLDGRCNQSLVALFDAGAIQAGPLATVPLRAPLAPAFHGVWVARGGQG
jgi:all-trans-8'-apo-beta-carotenal 15,15'-oxygenase